MTFNRLSTKTVVLEANKDAALPVKTFLKELDQKRSTTIQKQTVHYLAAASSIEQEILLVPSAMASITSHNTVNSALIFVDVRKDEDFAESTINWHDYKLVFKSSPPCVLPKLIVISDNEKNPRGIFAEELLKNHNLTNFNCIAIQRLPVDKDKDYTYKAYIHAKQDTDLVISETSFILNEEEKARIWPEKSNNTPPAASDKQAVRSIILPRVISSIANQCKVTETLNVTAGNIFLYPLYTAGAGTNHIGCMLQGKNGEVIELVIANTEVDDANIFANIRKQCLAAGLSKDTPGLFSREEQLPEIKRIICNIIGKKYVLQRINQQCYKVTRDLRFADSTAKIPIVLVGSNIPDKFDAEKMQARIEALQKKAEELKVMGYNIQGCQIITVNPYNLNRHENTIENILAAQCPCPPAAEFLGPDYRELEKIAFSALINSNMDKYLKQFWQGIYFLLRYINVASTQQIPAEKQQKITCIKKILDAVYQQCDKPNEQGVVTTENQQVFDQQGNVKQPREAISFEQKLQPILTEINTHKIVLKKDREIWSYLGDIALAVSIIGLTFHAYRYFKHGRHTPYTSLSQYLFLSSRAKSGREAAQAGSALTQVIARNTGR
jgi:hypothetical protein